MRLVAGPSRSTELITATAGFESGLPIPATLVDRNLLDRLARNIPRGRKAIFIGQRAKKAGVPVSVAHGVYAIETSFRPWWVRLAENLCLAVMLGWWLATGRPFLNMTVGPFQVGFHWMAQYLGIDYMRRDNWWLPKRSWRLACGLLRLPCFALNVEVAAYRLKLLWESAIAAGLDRDRAIVMVGAGYNGRMSYGHVLAELVRRWETG